MTYLETILQEEDVDYFQFLGSSYHWKFESLKNHLKMIFSDYENCDTEISIAKLKEAIPGIENTEWSTFLTQADTRNTGKTNLEFLKIYFTLNILNK